MTTNTKFNTREEYEAAAIAATTPKALKRVVDAAQSYKAEYGVRPWFERRWGHSEACSGLGADWRYRGKHDDDRACCFNAAMNAWITAATAWGN